MADATEWPQPNSARGAPWATASQTSSPGLVSARQQPDHVARHLPDVVVLDAAAEAGQQSGAHLGGGRFVDRDGDRPVVADGDRVGAHVLLAEHARAVVDAELPVVPRARQQVTVERALRQAVPLVRAGVVQGVDAAGGAHQADAPTVHTGHAHRADRQIVDGQAEVDGDATRSRLEIMGTER